MFLGSFFHLLLPDCGGIGCQTVVLQITRDVPTILRIYDYANSREEEVVAARPWQKVRKTNNVPLY